MKSLELVMLAMLLASGTCFNAFFLFFLCRQHRHMCSILYVPFISYKSDGLLNCGMVYFSWHILIM